MIWNRMTFNQLYFSIGAYFKEYLYPITSIPPNADKKKYAELQCLPL